MRGCSIYPSSSIFSISPPFSAFSKSCCSFKCFSALRRLNLQSQPGGVHVGDEGGLKELNMPRRGGQCSPNSTQPLAPGRHWPTSCSESNLTPKQVEAQQTCSFTFSGH